MDCKTHPDAPHGFLRNASHTEGRYVCECEYWKEDMKTIIEMAKEAEREACAKVCDARYMGDNNREDMEAKRCADAIRARGNT